MVVHGCPYCSITVQAHVCVCTCTGGARDAHTDTINARTKNSQGNKAMVLAKIPMVLAKIRLPHSIKQTHSTHSSQDSKLESKPSRIGRSVSTLTQSTK